MLQEGLNIIELNLWNKVAILKQLWNVATRKECLWVKWVRSYFIKNKELETMIIPKTASWVVRKILSSREVLLLGQNGQRNLMEEFAKSQKSEKYSTQKMYKHLSPMFPKVE